MFSLCVRGAGLSSLSLTYCRVSNVIDYSLTRNYVQLRVIIFISCNFSGLRVIEEISISRNFGVISCNFYNVISRNFVMITRTKRKYNYA